jgi:hypothetical protein
MNQVSADKLQAQKDKTVVRELLVSTMKEANSVLEDVRQS